LTTSQSASLLPQGRAQARQSTRSRRLF